MSHIVDYEKVFLPNFTDTMKTPEGETLTIHFETMPVGTLDLQQKTMLDIHGVLFPSEHLSIQFCPIDIAVMKHAIFGVRVACVRIRCKETAPVRWELAKGFFPTRPDHMMHEVRVDSGSLQIAHPNFQETAQSKDDFEASLTVEQEHEFWSKSSMDGYEAFDIKTAYGDGTYMVYAGYDDAGVVCRLVCDFVNMER